MVRSTGADLNDIVRSAIGVATIASAVVFIRRAGSVLELAAAAGIEGPALDGLSAAVTNPDHPISRALADDGPTFDVTPMAPGGPALRSHLPLIAMRGEGRVAVGVLAVAHDRSLNANDRRALEGLAEAAAASIE